ncbi:hypothetical protein [Pseudomonas aeruginosa]|uniref:hypothetical protein n=1 Tax=Pseudomonas aeruginosa TaxID=287 RepID=UPI000F7F2C38|nr:hypothetical protein [Pseudomonas aeruginosa]EKU4547773.1 hypothetical protein [Pseudomonas aeruginosa]ELQ4315379.1 hypothetical protein [Pseudomonas aeruginosa]ELQ8020245.1 hypothetical protein [Pseudomonas aeruginosa]ELT2309670.1 hypothetical protein [Pseudomonas aeruginosa]ELV9517091.1 hypothetical protein [Pseudomonas aeruginosa]
MNEQRLLEQAAKSAGLINHKYCDAWKGMAAYTLQEGFYGPTWNPLKDDGDALRLAVKLRTSILLASNNTACESVGDDYWFDDGIDAAAARRAIVNAAARIGRAMP